MKKLLTALLVGMATCALALSLGCSSSGTASSAPASESASAEATVASSESADASASAAASAGTPVADTANLSNGDYQIAVTLEGGSGKATVDSPAKLMVQDGAMTAVIVWSSPNYDLMIVDGTEYYPVPRAGNSTFEIPVSALDVDLPIQAETTAMSEPHMIDYTLHFDSSTLTQ